MYDLIITPYSKTSTYTQKICEEGWFIWLKPKGSTDPFKESMVCRIYNDIYNTMGDSHGYCWYTLPNLYIDGQAKPCIWYTTKDEAMAKAINFINRDIELCGRRDGS